LRRRRRKKFVNKHLVENLPTNTDWLINLHGKAAQQHAWSAAAAIAHMREPTANR
jgi:hypothetical protein